MLALQCIKYFIPFRWLNCAWNVAGAGFSRAGLIRQHLLHWEKSVSFLISCQAADALCLMVLRICHRFLSSSCHLLMHPPPPLYLPFSRPLSPSLLFTHTHSSAVITEQALYKRAGSSPSVQPPTPPTLGAAPEPGPCTWFLRKLSFLVSSPCLHFFHFLSERNSVSSRLIYLTLIRLRRWQILNTLQREQTTLWPHIDKTLHYRDGMRWNPYGQINKHREVSRRHPQLMLFSFTRLHLL